MSLNNESDYQIPGDGTSKNKPRYRIVTRRHRDGPIPPFAFLTGSSEQIPNAVAKGNVMYTDSYYGYPIAGRVLPDSPVAPSSFAWNTDGFGKVDNPDLSGTLTVVPPPPLGERAFSELDPVLVAELTPVPSIELFSFIDGKNALRAWVGWHICTIKERGVYIPNGTLVIHMALQPDQEGFPHFSTALQQFDEVYQTLMDENTLHRIHLPPVRIYPDDRAFIFLATHPVVATILKSYLGDRMIPHLIEELRRSHLNTRNQLRRTTLRGNGSIIPPEDFQPHTVIIPLWNEGGVPYTQDTLNDAYADWLRSGRPAE